MRFEIVTAEQRSPEWFAARLGRLCASDAGKMLATVKSGEAAARRDLRLKLVCERLTGRPVEDSFQNADMARGIELEPQARIAYEFLTGVSVQQTGFLRHLEYPVGCSPDGVVGDFDGLVEIKCPRSARHLEYLNNRAVPADYRPQLLHQLWVSGAGYVDFVSFDQAMPERLQLAVTRLMRDEKDIADYEKKALAFLAEVEREYAALMPVTEQLTAAMEATA